MSYLIEETLPFLFLQAFVAEEKTQSKTDFNVLPFLSNQYKNSI